jgi:hypothetical protein
MRLKFIYFTREEECMQGFDGKARKNETSRKI